MTPEEYLKKSFRQDNIKKPVQKDANRVIEEIKKKAVSSLAEKETVVEPIVEEVFDVPYVNEPVDTPNGIVDKINSSTGTIKKERVEGLEQAILNSTSNAFTSLPATTMFVNGNRSKNLSVTGTGTAVTTQGDTSTISISPFAAIPNGKFISIGDSYVANGVVLTPPNYFETSQNLIATTARLMGQRIIEISNKGISGQTTAQVLARFTTDVLQNAAGFPDWVYICCGTNDFYANSLSGTVAFNNIVSMINIAKNAGVRVVVNIQQPQGATGGVSPAAGWSAAKFAEQTKYRNLMLAYGLNNPNVVILDTFGMTVNPLSTTGDILSTSWTYDGVHPTNYAVYYGAKKLVTLLNPLIPIIDNGPVSQADSYGTNANSINAINNPLLVTATGGTASAPHTGTVASGWTTSNNAGAAAVACSVVARADGYGNNQRLVITPGAANDAVLMTGTDYTGRFASGDRVFVEWEVTVTNPGTLRNIVGFWTMTFSSTTPTVRTGTPLVAANEIVYPENVTFKVRTPPLLITGTPSGTAIPLLNFIFTGASSAVTIDVGRCQIIKY